MFDVGFFELMLIGVVALVVVGPDKLPGLTRTAGMWIGKARRTLNEVKADIEQEIKTDELNKMLTEQKERLDESLHTIVESTDDSYTDIKAENTNIKVEDTKLQKQNTDD